MVLFQFQNGAIFVNYNRSLQMHILYVPEEVSRKILT